MKWKIPEVVGKSVMESVPPCTVTVEADEETVDVALAILKAAVREAKPDIRLPEEELISKEDLEDFRRQFFHDPVNGIELDYWKGREVKLALWVSPDSDSKICIDIKHWNDRKRLYPSVISPKAVKDLRNVLMETKWKLSVR